METDHHVRRTGDDYTQALINLLPVGPAWPREVGSILYLACRGLSDYWGYVDGRAGDLLEIESDPRATRELLIDWERNWGLPDPCRKDPPSALNERRLALLTKMTMIGGQSRQFFIDLAKTFGYTITITEHAPYMCGVSRVGDTRWYNPDDPEHYYWELGPPELRFYWNVHVYSLSLIYFHCNSSQTGIDRLLRIGTADDLECLLGRIKPAQTHIVYDYSPHDALDFTQAYNTEYLTLGML